MPGTTGGPAIPDRNAPAVETSTGITDKRPGSASQGRADWPDNSQLDPEGIPNMEAAESVTDRPAERPARSQRPETAAPDPGINALEQAITQSVTNAYVKAGIRSATLANVNVRTTTGRVILSGQVKTRGEKERLEAEARNIPGVKAVISQLRIVPDVNEATERATGLGTPGKPLEGAGAGSQAQ
jgi:hypothetical protein